MTFPYKPQLTISFSPKSLTHPINHSPLPRRPLRHPRLDKRHLIHLRLLNRSRRQRRRRLVWKQPVLIPVMNGSLNENERLIRRAGPRFRFRCVGRRGAPRVIFAVEEGEFVVADGVAAVGVDGGGVGGCGDVEGVAADDGFVGEGEGAGDEGELGLGDGGAGLEEAPLTAVLVGPASPGLGDVVQGVEGCVVRGVAFICCLAPCDTGLDRGYVEIADEVQHLSCKGCGLRGVATGRH